VAVLIEAWLERAATVRPGAIAVEEPGAGCTYAELLALARDGAADLRAHGVEPGDRVAIALPAGIEFARVLHATLLLGAIAVPVDLRLRREERAQVVAGAQVVIEQPLGPAGAAGGSAASARPTRHDLDAVAVVIHTSGTSAAPKPVALTYGNFLWSALGSAVALGADRGERWLSPLPLSHVGGLSILVRSAIQATTAVLHERFEADRVLRALREQRITLVSLVAQTLERLLAAGLQRPPSLRCALVGGGPVPAELIARARAAGVPVSATYGLTEASSQVATAPVAAPERGALPLFCTRVRIDPRSREILVRGPTVAPACADEEGWLHTGDVGGLDESGALHVAGRLSETIISGGENIAPAEVEEALSAHPGVAEAAVFGRPDSDWGEAVSAVVVASAGETLDVDLLRAHCAQRLAPYKVPKELRVVPGPLPRTSSGKLMRRALAAAADGEASAKRVSDVPERVSARSDAGSGEAA
jgi:O-succinylbenzoic acid--CoA ligase